MNDDGLFVAFTRCPAVHRLRKVIAETTSFEVSVILKRWLMLGHMQKKVTIGIVEQNYSRLHFNRAVISMKLDARLQNLRSHRQF